MSGSTVLRSCLPSFNRLIRWPSWVLAEAVQHESCLCARRSLKSNQVTMVPRIESDEKYILDLVAEVLAEPEYRWQHRFPTLLGDPGKDGRCRPLPVDGYFPRHRLIVEYWERQHSAPVPFMDEGLTISGVSRGHQRRLYDQRRQTWAEINGMRLVIL